MILVIPNPSSFSVFCTEKPDWVGNRSVYRAYQVYNMEKSPHHAPHLSEDEDLILKVAQGDRSAFSLLYDRHSTVLYSMAMKIVVNEAEAQDLLQEVFLSIWNKATTFQAERGSAFAWMATQLRNRAIDRLRSRRRRGELLETHALDLEPTGSATTTSAEDYVVNERAREVRSALRKLTNDQRLVLRLAYFEGLTQSEIAEKLEEPLGTIKARAHRGLAQLRSILRSFYE